MLSSVFVAGIGLFYIIFIILCAVAFVIITISMWKIFKKAGRPGWASIIPFYSIWVLMEITCKNNLLWFVLFMVPVTSGIASIIASVGLNKCFNKGIVNLVLLILVPMIGYPMIAFGSSEYNPDDKF